MAVDGKSLANSKQQRAYVYQNMGNTMTVQGGNLQLDSIRKV